MSSNHCEWIVDHIDAFVDGDLSETDAERVRQHTSTCSECADELILAHSMLEELRRMPQLHVSPDIVDRAESAARATAAQPGIQERIATWFGDRIAIMTRPAMVAMTILIVAVGVFVLTQRDAALNHGGPEMAQAEQARNEVLVAFAYIGKYTSRGSQVMSKEVGKHLVPTVSRVLVENGTDVIARSIGESMNHIGTRNRSKNTVTNDELKRSED